MQAEFEPLECVDGSLVPWPPHTNVTLSPEHPGWTFKAFALHSTTFQEVRLRLKTVRVLPSQTGGWLGVHTRSSAPPPYSCTSCACGANTGSPAPCAVITSAQASAMQYAAAAPSAVLPPEGFMWGRHGHSLGHCTCTAPAAHLSGCWHAGADAGLGQPAAGRPNVPVRRGQVQGERLPVLARLLVRACGPCSSGFGGPGQSCGCVHGGRPGARCSHSLQRDAMRGAALWGGHGLSQHAAPCARLPACQPVAALPRSFGRLCKSAGWSPWQAPP